MILATGRNDRRRGAFTLIELIMVLALLVIITSIAVPAMSRFVRGRALEAEGRRLMALMHAAQSRAVSEGVPMLLWVDEKGGAYGVTAEVRSQKDDPRAESLNVDATLAIAVTALATGSQTTYQNLPAIKYLPDGTIDEGSPQQLRLSDSDGFQLRLMETKMRTGYEVGTGN